MNPDSTKADEQAVAELLAADMLAMQRRYRMLKPKSIARTLPASLSINIHIL